MICDITPGDTEIIKKRLSERSDKILEDKKLLDDCWVLIDVLYTKMIAWERDYGKLMKDHAQNYLTIHTATAVISIMEAVKDLATEKEKELAIEQMAYDISNELGAELESTAKDLLLQKKDENDGN